MFKYPSNLARKQPNNKNEKKKKDTAVVPTGPMERVTKPVESELEKGKGNKRNISQGIILVGLNS